MRQKRAKEHSTSQQGEKEYTTKEKVYEGFSDSGVPMDTPVQVGEVTRTLFAVREIKAAKNMILWGVDEEHAVINKKTGKLNYNGGGDAVIKKVSHAVTKIIDTGKDYIMNMWLKKPEGTEVGSMDTISTYNQLGHGRWGKEIKTQNRFREMGEDEQVATF